LGGIKPDAGAPGFKNILLEPHFVAGLNQCEVTHQSPYGNIVSSWKRVGKKITYTVVVPPNATAKLTLTVPAKQKLFKNGNSIQATGLFNDQITAGRFTYELK
jgi:alpha-L-rhamnosidase